MAEARAEVERVAQERAAEERAAQERAAQERAEEARAVEQAPERSPYPCLVMLDFNLPTFKLHATLTLDRHARRRRRSSTSEDRRWRGWRHAHSIVVSR